MSNKLYVGMTGRAGSGKDYVADALMSALAESNISSAKVPFAAGVREEIESELIGYGQELPRLHIKPTSDAVRRLLQWWGTDFRRAQDPDYWVNWARESAEEADVDVVFFTDTRFDNEVDFILNDYGIVFKVLANPSTREARIGPVPDHASEQLADSLPFHMAIHNNKQYEPLEISYALEMIRRRVRRS